MDRTGDVGWCGVLGLRALHVVRARYHEEAGRERIGALSLFRCIPRTRECLRPFSLAKVIGGEGQ